MYLDIFLQAMNSESSTFLTSSYWSCISCNCLQIDKKLLALSRDRLQEGICLLFIVQSKYKVETCLILLKDSSSCLYEVEVLIVYSQNSQFINQDFIFITFNLSSSRTKSICYFVLQKNIRKSFIIFLIDFALLHNLDISDIRPSYIFLSFIIHQKARINAHFTLMKRAFMKMQYVLLQFLSSKYFITDHKLELKGFEKMKLTQPPKKLQQF